MPPKSLSFKCELLDIESENLVENVFIHINDFREKKGNFRNNGTIILDKDEPKYKEKHFILKLVFESKDGVLFQLDNEFKDDVMLTLHDEMVNKIYLQSHYSIQFTGQTWRSPEWGKYINGLFNHPYP